MSCKWILQRVNLGSANEYSSNAALPAKDRSFPRCMIRLACIDYNGIVQRVIPLATCRKATTGYGFCNKAELMSGDPQEGPFQLRCRVCGIETPVCEDIGKLADAWRAQVVARHVMDDL